ncbi:MAG: DNA/RNA nuclease SfsA [Candidatus Marinimicrobia bacterium]|nr:DNA/RNA nuclease SfsA [Candidatus Neomarinimicrobiota bacterium]|tara:strand:- start:4985 stop:5689 length:705 start_codon:yes stop_codon:yes gene_type:complete
MNIAGPLEDARFVERPNRFLTVVDIGGKAVESHLPDPGRLRELLIPGASLKVRPINGNSSSRRTGWTTVMVKSGRQWVSIDSTLPNRFVENLLETGQLPIFESYRLIKREVKVGNHRFDFLLEKGGVQFYLEVKSVTFVENGVAQFPDAVTERGARHALYLAEMSREGVRTGILFVCQRPDASLFRPMWERDRKFAEALVEAKDAGVQINVITAEVAPEAISYHQEIPFDLSFK